MPCFVFCSRKPFAWAPLPKNPANVTQMGCLTIGIEPLQNKQTSGFAGWFPVKNQPTGGSPKNEEHTPIGSFQRSCANLFQVLGSNYGQRVSSHFFVPLPAAPGVAKTLPDLACSTCCLLGFFIFQFNLPAESLPFMPFRLQLALFHCLSGSLILMATLAKLLLAAPMPHRLFSRAGISLSGQRPI